MSWKIFLGLAILIFLLYFGLIVFTQTNYVYDFLTGLAALSAVLSFISGRLYRQR